MYRGSESRAPSHADRWALPLLIVGLFLVGGLFAVPSGGSSSSATTTPGASPRSLPLPTGGTTYALTFTENGLPGGSSWSVHLSAAQNTSMNATHSSSSSSISFSVTNGTYVYSPTAGRYFGAHPGTGNLTVAGSPQSVTINFTELYNVSFNETGLPTGGTGPMWELTFSGTSTWYFPGTALLQEPNGTYAYSFPSIAGYTSPKSGTVHVAGAPVTVAAAYRALPTYNITFLQRGLPNGTPWGVDLANASQRTTTSSLVFALYNSSYSYRIVDPTGYSASPSNGTFNVSGNASTIGITFSPIETVQFNESGLPAGTAWYVTINGARVYSQNASIAVSEPNGSYPYWISNVSGYSHNPTGTVKVNGAPVYVGVPYFLLAGYYVVTFQEGGLTQNGSTVYPGWTAGLGGSNSSNSTIPSISFTVTNGTYAYTVPHALNYYPSPANGTVHVTGANVTVSIQFTARNPPPTYAVIFTEQGLASGASWWVVLSNTTTQYSANHTSTSSTVSFSVVNGTYAYQAGASYAKSLQGSVPVNGSRNTVALTFRTSIPNNYTVTFTESGLPNATRWWVDADGQSANSSTLSLVLHMGNGTFAWTAASIANGTSVNSTGNVTIRGGNASVSVTFNVPAPPLVALQFRSTGVVASANWAVALTSQGGGLRIELAVASLTRSAAGNAAIVFHVSPGSYAYVASANGERSASGSVDVVAATTPAPIQVAFIPAPPIGSTHPTTSSPPLTGSTVAGIALLFVGGLGAAILGLRTYRGRSVNRSAVDALLATEWQPDADGHPVPRRQG